MHPFAILLFPLIISANTESIPDSPHCKFIPNKKELECMYIAHQFPPSVNDHNCENCTLKCEYRSFKYLNASSFASVDQKSNIEKIRFNGGKTDRIASNAFQSFDSVQKIILAENQLKYIEEGAFSDIPHIEKIYIRHNELTELPQQISKNENNSLLFLDLGDNQIRKFYASSFSNLTSLVELNLDNNQLCSIPLGAFDGLDQLSILRLSSNKLKKLNKEMFVGLPNLRILDLSHNQLVRTNLQYFKYLDSYSSYSLHLDLSDTSMHYLDGVNDAFIFTRLEKIDLSKNIWSCSILENVIWSFEDRSVEVEHGNDLNITNIFGIACLEGRSKENKLTDENITYDEFRKIVVEDSENTSDICR